jgi:two-component system chemotaxis sensor kinase CheA
MCGFDSLAAFAHEIETVFEHIRNGVLSSTKDLVSLSFSALDQMRTMIDKGEELLLSNCPEAQEMIVSFRDFLPEGTTGHSSAEASPFPPENETRKKGIYRIQFRPSPDTFQKGVNPIFLLNELRGLGECEVQAYGEEIPVLDELNPEMCHTYWDIYLYTNQTMNAIKDVFIFVEDDCDLAIECFLDEEDTVPESGGKAGSAALEHKDKGEASERRRKDRRQQTDRRRPSSEEASSVRVPAVRLDRLVNLVGEMVTVQARLSQIAASGLDTELLAVSEEIEYLTEELRDTTMTIRMVPIGTTFSKFRRLVRDLSLDLGKEVELRTEGAETELDKTVIERLSDPLMHLIRNSIDHGIEAPDKRRTSGKPAKGAVNLSALHSGPYVLIEIRDDGEGLDAEVIKAKAVEKGIVPEDADLSEKELFGLVFSPGFSTAKDLTNVSGRGVGLDVVKRSVEALRGSIDIESVKGTGTRITLKIPLTLAIIEGLLVKISDGYFVIPLSLVEECIELVKKDSGKSRRRIINVRNEIVPYIRLREHFSLDGEPPAIEQVVITKSNSDKVGFAVDSVIGEHQTVIKSLGGFYKNIEGISGATILGDGTVALILDVQKLVQDVRNLAQPERMEEAAE